MQPPPSRSATLSSAAQMLRRPRINPAQQADMDRMKVAVNSAGGAAPPMGVKISPPAPVSAPPTVQGRPVNADGASITGANGGRQELGAAAMRKLRGFAAGGGAAPGGFGGGSGPIMAPEEMPGGVGMERPGGGGMGPRPMTPEIMPGGMGERSGAKPWQAGLYEAQPTPMDGEAGANPQASEIVNRLRGFGPGGDPAGGRGFIPPRGAAPPGGMVGADGRSGPKPWQGGELQSSIADTEGQDLGDGAVAPQVPIWKRLAGAMAGQRGGPMGR